jgi:hypothetical protein
MNSLNNQSATNNATDADAEAVNQAQATKTYTQQDVDNMMARMRGTLEKKLLKPWEDLGDPEELRNLKAEADKRAQAEQIKRGEFEKTLQDLAAKKDAEIQKRDQIIKEYKVNTPLVSAAAKYKAVNADQVKALLSNQLRLNEDGEVEVLDTKGSVRYSDAGSPLAVDDLVREFLDSNPHFVAASPATTHSKSNSSGFTAGGFDLAKLDLSNPADRKKYAEAKQAGIIK